MPMITGASPITPQMLQATLTDPRATPQMRAAAVAQLQAMNGGAPQGGAPQDSPSPLAQVADSGEDSDPSAWLSSGAAAAGGGASEEMPDLSGGTGDLAGWRGDFMQMIKQQMASPEGELTSEDKSLALAKAGFGMAASNSPNFGTALGQGAVYGIEGLEKLKAQRAQERLRRDVMGQAALDKSEGRALQRQTAQLAHQDRQDATQQRADAAGEAAQARADALALRGENAKANQGIQTMLAQAAQERAAAATAAAPKGVEPPSIDQAKSVGIPVKDIPNPYSKVGAKAAEDMFKSNEKLFETDQVKQALTQEHNNEVRSDLKRFAEINETGKTGPSLAIPGVGSVKKFTDPELQEADSIVSRLAPTMRQGLPGAASDQDIKMFRGGGPEIIKDKQANTNRITALNAALDNQDDKAQFRKDFFSVHHHFQGADGEWNKYLKANPIFDHAKGAAPYTLNPNRKRYSDWFRESEFGDTPSIEPEAAPLADPLGIRR